MSESFKQYRSECFKIIKDLLAHKPTEQLLYSCRARESKTSEELSRIMVDVRHEI